ncbi:MAG: hypothetical protein GY828_05350, partial [Candidatus Gracilibacteria bacterium]|nr:hypothetical protein [Candidatus Gracilibacteria bacterium]
EKKTDIVIQTNKKQYAPREVVELDIMVTDTQGKHLESELTIMDVDDSLISLLGNVDLNLLEKFYKKLPFQIQTQMTAVAMVKNFYFSRSGIVGGSGDASFKGGDSSLSTRNIFKNTAFYSADVKTDKNGKSHVSFILPDNLTNFRIMVVSNSKNNYFGYQHEFIEVRKNILIEDKTPFIMRGGDSMTLGANIFNLSDEKQELTVRLDSEGLQNEESEQIVTLKPGKKKFIEWDVTNVTQDGNIEYSITAEGKTAFYSDKIEKTIPVYQSPSLIKRQRISTLVEVGNHYETEIQLPENIDMKQSKVELLFSNNRLYGIEKTVSSLLQYPYGCIEQTTSSTYPNAVVKKMNTFFGGIVPEKKVDENIKAGLERIQKMQVADGGFAYWIGETESNPYITPYVVRTLLDMQEMGVTIDSDMLEKAISYLEKIYVSTKSQSIQTEIYWTLSKAKKSLWFDKRGKTLSRHELLAYTYGLYYQSASGNNDIISYNIAELSKKFQKNQSQQYWNNHVDKAIFLQLLLDVNDEGYESLIDTYIQDFYQYDLENYYYSTFTSN